MIERRDVTDYLLNRSKMNISLSATDVQMKTLNLTRDCCTVLPHVLSKINRVHFESSRITRTYAEEEVISPQLDACWLFLS